MYSIVLGYLFHNFITTHFVVKCQFVGYFFGKLFINILLIEKNVESFNKVKLIEGNLFSVNAVTGINLTNDKCQ